MNEERIVRGTVIENNLGCTRDLHCYLRVMSSEQELRVVYHAGRGSPCLNTGVIQRAMQLKAGDAVEVFGKVVGSSELSTCESQAYYIEQQ